MLTPTLLKQISKAVTVAKNRAEFRNIDDENFVEGHMGEAMDGNIGRLFDSHGIAKGTIEEQLKSLNSILSLGPAKDKNFYTAPWSIPNEDRAGVGAALGTAGGTAYKSGNFVIVSKIGRQISGKNDIGYVAVNTLFYKQIPILQNAFPGVKFVKMNEMPRVLTNTYQAVIQKILAHTNIQKMASSTGVRKQSTYFSPKPGHTWPEIGGLLKMAGLKTSIYKSATAKGYVLRAFRNEGNNEHFLKILEQKIASMAANAITKQKR